MSEKLSVNFYVEKEVAKKVSLASGTLCYARGMFETQFSDLTKNAQTLIYDFIYKNDRGFRVDLTDLPSFYNTFEKHNVPFERFNFTKDFFEGKQISEFISHYYDMKNEFLRLEESLKLSSDRMSENLHIIYYLHPNYVEAKKALQEEISPKQAFFTLRSFVEEDTFIRLAKYLKKENNNFYLDLTTLGIEHPMLLAPSVLTDRTVTEFLNTITRLLEEIDGNSPTPDEKKEWIKRYGSTHLKRAFQMKYNCQRQYVSERAATEHPDFILDFDLESKRKERPFPSEKALDAEEKLRKGKSLLNVRVEWMQRPEKECEVVVIHDYLGKYLLYKKI